MPTEKYAACTSSLPVYSGNKYLNKGSECFSIMKKFKANFIIEKDEDGVLCAVDLEQGIFADGKTYEELMADIREAVECHFNIAPEYVDRDVDINIISNVN